MKRKNAATLQDIAREAGVSAMTASVVLNGASSSTRVSEGTRARIREVAARLHYRPNAVARGLSRRRMDTIGVACLLDRGLDGGELNLYFLEVLNGILEATAQHRQNTMIFSVNDWQRDEPKLLDFCDGRVDGVICVGPMFSPAFAEALQQHTPFITLHSNEALPNMHNLDVDNEAGAFTVTQYLISQGHRRILHFSGALSLTGPQCRLNGYKRALASAGIPFDDSLVVPGHYSAFSGRERMALVLDAGLPAPRSTALFCASDAIASGAMEVLAERGLRVPQDLSIAGFDDSLAARMTVPPLTTVRQPLREMGRCAVALLLPQIGNIAPTEASAAFAPHPDLFETELIVRGSVGPPPSP